MSCRRAARLGGVRPALQAVRYQLRSGISQETSSDQSSTESTPSSPGSDEPGLQVKGVKIHSGVSRLDPVRFKPSGSDPVVFRIGSLAARTAYGHAYGMRARFDMPTVRACVVGILVTVLLGALTGATRGIAAGVIAALASLVGSAAVMLVWEIHQRQARKRELLNEFTVPEPLNAREDEE
jgi:hypothetical protein